MGRGGHEGLVRGFQDGGRVGLLARALQGRWMDRLGQVLAERPIGVQAPADAADRILDEGRFRTQFETGRSGGSMHGRAELEQHLWGLPPDLPAQQRPVYGALRSANVEEVPRRLPEWERGQAWQGLGHYGGHLFLLRPEAKARSTLTFDDSFALHPHAVIPSWEGGLGRPFRFGEIPPADAMARALAGRRPMLAESMGPGPGHRDIDFDLNSLGSPYIETQTPGPVAVDEVEALLVPESVSPRVRGMARDRGIPVYDHEEVAHDRDLQRQLRLRVLPAAGGAGAAFEGLVGGREDGARYQDGGRVGLLARGLGALGSYPLDPASGSQALLERGVPGVRYLDHGSRRAGAGTSNFVMFDDAPVEIVRRYRDGGQVGGPFEGLVGRAFAAGGLAAVPVAGGQPGPEDDIAAAQGAASRGLAQAQQMWLAAGRVLGA